MFGRKNSADCIGWHMECVTDEMLNTLYVKQ